MRPEVCAYCGKPFLTNESIVTEILKLVGYCGKRRKYNTSGLNKKEMIFVRDYLRGVKDGTQSKRG